MTLADLVAQLPMPFADLEGLAIVLDSSTATSWGEVQEQHGCESIRVAPVPLSDGRHMVTADMLVDCAPNGLLAEWFAHLDASQFGIVAVLPVADAVALIEKPIIE